MNAAQKAILCGFTGMALGRLTAQPALSRQKQLLEDATRQLDNLQQTQRTLADYAGVDADALGDASGQTQVSLEQLTSNLFVYGLPAVLRLLCVLYIGSSDVFGTPSVYAAHNWTRYFCVRCSTPVDNLTPTTFFDCDLYTGAVNRVQCTYFAKGGGLIDVQDAQQTLENARKRCIAVVGAGLTSVVLARGYVLPSASEGIDQGPKDHAYKGKSYGDYYAYIAKQCDLLTLRGKETILGAPAALLDGSPYLTCHAHSCSGIYRLDSVLRSALRHVAAYCVYDSQISSYHVFLGPSYVPVSSFQNVSCVMGGYHTLSLALLTPYLTPCAVLYTDELERYATTVDGARTMAYDHIVTMDSDAHDVAYRWLRGSIKEGTHARFLGKLNDFTLKLIRGGFAYLGLYAYHYNGRPLTDSSSTGYQIGSIHVRILPADEDWDNRVIQQYAANGAPESLFIVIDSPNILYSAVSVVSNAWKPTLPEFSTNGPVRSKTAHNTLIPLTPV